MIKAIYKAKVWWECGEMIGVGVICLFVGDHQGNIMCLLGLVRDDV